MKDITLSYGQQRIIKDLKDGWVILHDPEIRPEYRLIKDNVPGGKKARVQNVVNTWSWGLKGLSV